ncbi:MAG: DUF4344 domain-containing metallopeptidase, partial [Alphaproteobacteria bacterium]|nr:DUF4344 domain-containing metallopeptidase [Alphaproteobacteria bacterium]
MAVALAMLGIYVLFDQLSPKPASAGGLPPPSAYVPSPENDAKLHMAIDSVLSFVLLHETGHLLISEFDLPVLGREEDAADRFAVATMTINGASKQYEALLPVAAFWDAVHQLQDHYDWSDEHGEPEQRAFQIFCLVYGSDPDNHDEIARQIGLSPSRRQSCIQEAAKNLKDWLGLLKPTMNSTLAANMGIQVPSVAVIYDAVPAGLPENLRAVQNELRSIAMNEQILDVIGEQLTALKLPHYKQLGNMDIVTVNPNPGIVQHPDPIADLTSYDFVLRGDSCLDDNGSPVANAFWSAKSRSLTLCYGLIDQVAQIEKS